MEKNIKPNKTKPLMNILFRIGVCLAILFIGAIGMSKLTDLREPPAESPVEERRLRVEVVEVMPESVPIEISGYGEIRVLNEVNIAPEVSGKIVGVHPRLEVGEVIPAGEILFEIDDINYQASFKEATAAVTQWQTAIQRLKKQSTIDVKRLKTLQRNQDLAKAAFDRTRNLFEVDKVGTRSGVERTEQSYNATIDQTDQMAQAVTLYPMRIREAQSSLAAAKARLILAKANLARCRVKAAFIGRIKTNNVELGQYVTPGQPIVTLADDATLEIQVPLDSRDAQRWLRFDDAGTNRTTTRTTNWFAGLVNLPCNIHWTEDRYGHFWKGRLNRVVAFDAKTRTLTVAVRVDTQTAQEGDAKRFPLVEGMFCEVRIPGKSLQDVYRLPRGAVSFDNTVFISAKNRLKTIAVKVVRKDERYAYVSEGLNPKDKVITTRLIDPLESALLEISPTIDKKSQKAGSS